MWYVVILAYALSGHVEDAKPGKLLGVSPIVKIESEDDCSAVSDHLLAKLKAKFKPKKKIGSVRLVAACLKAAESI